MSIIKAYKTVFRVDFPPSWQILDNLGSVCERVKSEASRLKMAMNLNVDLVGHTITGHLKSNENRVKLYLSLETLNWIMEHERGRELGTFHSDPIFHLADGTIEYLQGENLIQFNRTGLRFWVLIQRPEFSFGRLRDHLVEKISFLQSATEDSSATTHDVGLVLESKTDGGLFIRTMLGPYQKIESAKYFSIPHEVDEGLIVDIDVAQRDIEVPGFRSSKATHDWERLVLDVITRVDAALSEDLR